MGRSAARVDSGHVDSAKEGYGDDGLLVFTAGLAGVNCSLGGCTGSEQGHSHTPYQTLMRETSGAEFTVYLAANERNN